MKFMIAGLAGHMLATLILLDDLLASRALLHGPIRELLLDIFDVFLSSSRHFFLLGCMIPQSRHRESPQTSQGK